MSMVTSGDTIPTPQSELTEFISSEASGDTIQNPHSILTETIASQTGTKSRQTDDDKTARQKPQTKLHTSLVSEEYASSEPEDSGSEEGSVTVTEGVSGVEVEVLDADGDVNIDDFRKTEVEEPKTNGKGSWQETLDRIQERVDNPKPYPFPDSTETEEDEDTDTDRSSRNEEDADGDEDIQDAYSDNGERENCDTDAVEQGESMATKRRDDASELSCETEEEEETVEPQVRYEIEKFNRTFKDVATRYRLLNKIGEGTFSTVYKAEDLLYEQYENEWETMLPGEVARRERERAQKRPKYVAIKKIYVTSSPARILNELELLHHLTGLPNIVPLITAFRHQDQVVAVLPYYKHVDFRDYFHTMKMNDIRLYLKSLMTALESVHNFNIIHRDIKPTNFLYDPVRRQGVLCDFGLAEEQCLENGYCPCNIDGDNVKFPFQPDKSVSSGYLKNDQRLPRRANRAGTRGFRAPEVLFKCPNQSTKIDMWSVGVILLTILTKRFPFFNSADDVDALIEIATITGKARMRNCAALHGCSFETTIPTISEKGYTWEKIVLWATGRTNVRKDSRGKEVDDQLSRDEKLAVELMDRLFDLDPLSRITAKEALEHDFLTLVESEDESCDEYYDDEANGESDYDM